MVSSCGMLSPNGPSDPDFASVVLLLHGEGLNGGTSFIDSSSYGHTMTPAGGAHTSVVQKKAGSTSIKLNGSTDYLTTPAAGGEWDFGTLPWTIEAYFYLTAAPNAEASVLCMNSDDAGFQVLDFRIDSFQRCIFQCSWTALSGGGDVSLQNGLGAATLNTWHHMAFVRNGATAKGYFNGVEFTGTGGLTVSSALKVPVDPIKVGRRPMGVGTFNYFPGYIDELRVTRGVARYTASFTPPSVPFPNS